MNAVLIGAFDNGKVFGHFAVIIKRAVESFIFSVKGVSNFEIDVVKCAVLINRAHTEFEIAVNKGSSDIEFFFGLVAYFDAEGNSFFINNGVGKLDRFGKIGPVIL